MGRYYNGDIEGKFWFGVQSSYAADRFGVSGVEPSYIDYYFSNDDLPSVEEEITNIELKLGNYKHLLDNFFAMHDGYTKEQLNTCLNVPDAASILEDYADLLLGIKIKDCIIANGECNFSADV